MADMTTTAMLCPRCNSKDIYWSKSGYDVDQTHCTDCGHGWGDGYPDIAAEPIPEDWSDCDVCSGQGQIYYGDNCYACNGVGITYHGDVEPEQVFLRFDDELSDSVRAKLFGALVAKTQGILKINLGDLYHDVHWIEQRITKYSGRSFFYGVRESGTDIGWLPMADHNQHTWLVQLVVHKGSYGAVFTPWED